MPTRRPVKIPTWSHDDCRNLLEKGSIVPLPPIVYPPTPGYWARVLVCTAIGIGLAFAYGAWIK